MFSLHRRLFHFPFLHPRENGKAISHRWNVFFPRSSLFLFKDSILVTWIPRLWKKKKSYGKSLLARLISIIHPIFQGYTPLHIAMQFDHENIFNLLVQVYGEYDETLRKNERSTLSMSLVKSDHRVVSMIGFQESKCRKNIHFTYLTLDLTDFMLKNSEYANIILINIDFLM